MKPRNVKLTTKGGCIHVSQLYIAGINKNQNAKFAYIWRTKHTHYRV